MNYDDIIIEKRLKKSKYVAWRFNVRFPWGQHAEVMEAFIGELKYNKSINRKHIRFTKKELSEAKARASKILKDLKIEETA